MSARRAVWEVARRELVERSRSRVLRVSLVLLLVLGVGAAVAAARLTGTHPTDDVGLVGSRSAAFARAIDAEARLAGRRAHLHMLRTEAQAARAVRSGALDAALVGTDRILVKGSRSQAAVRVLQQAIAAQLTIERLRRMGLDRTRALSLLSPPALPVDVLAPRPAGYDRNQGLIAIGLIALLMSLVFTGQAVAQGVTEEKSSRVVELLLTAVTPRRLLAGKVLGMGVLGILMLSLTGLAALAAGALAGGQGLPSAAPETVALILLWFVLGYAFYSVAFAMVGALVSRQEDLNTAMLPVNALLLGAFYLALIVANTSPNGTFARVVAFLPPFSPLVVPGRVVLGNMGALGLIAAVALELLATAAMVVLAARVYERSILHIGAPVKLRLAVAQGLGLPAPAAASSLEPPHGRSAPTVASGRERLSGHRAQTALRAGAIALLVAGVAVGFGHPVGIAAAVVGVLLAVAAGRRRPRDAHRR